MKNPLNSVFGILLIVLIISGAMWFGLDYSTKKFYTPIRQENYGVIKSVRFISGSYNDINRTEIITDKYTLCVRDNPIIKNGDILIVFYSKDRMFIQDATGEVFKIRNL